MPDMQDSCAEICFSSDDSPIRITHGRYTSSSASSEYEDAELVHTEVSHARNITGHMRYTNVYQLITYPPGTEPGTELVRQSCAAVLWWQAQRSMLDPHGSA